MEMTLEINGKFVEANTRIGNAMITPPLDAEYWLFRVQVAENQAVVGFPKFGTIGIGFQHEDEDWNTNLPYQCSAYKIYGHIAVNSRGADRATCIQAIRKIQAAARQWQKTHNQ